MHHFVLIHGYAGATGPTGPTGATGATGATGPTGAIATNAFNAISTAAQTPTTANEALTFDTNQIAEGSAISHTANSGDFTLNETGIYEIRYNSIVNDAAGSTPPVTAVLTIERDGTKIQGTASSATLTATDQSATLAGSTIASVTTAPTTISLVSSNTGADFTDTNINIVKLS